MDISLDENCPVRDKLLVENGLSYDPRPVRDAIWVEVIGKPPPAGRISDFGLTMEQLRCPSGTIYEVTSLKLLGRIYARYF